MPNPYAKLIVQLRNCEPKRKPVRAVKHTRFVRSQEDDRFLLAKQVYEKKIFTFARQNIGKMPGVSVGDLAQEITIVLWRCVTLYDPNNGAGFSTFFWTAAQNRMKDLITAARRQKRESEWFETLSTFAATNIHGPSLEWTIDQYMQEASPEDWACLHEEVRERYEQLPARQQKFVIGL